MRAFLIALAALVAIAGVSAGVLIATDSTTGQLYATENVRLQ